MNRLLVCAVCVAVMSSAGLWYGRTGSGQAMAKSDGPASQQAPAAKGAAASPSFSIHIDPQWQQIRLAQCNSRKAQFEAMGLWVQGDVAPVVVHEKWRQLDVRQKNDVLDTAACIANGGQILEIVVSVLDRDSGKVLETRRMVSARDFDQLQE